MSTGAVDIHDSDLRQAGAGDMPVNADKLEWYWQESFHQRVGHNTRQIGTLAKVGATAGWTVGAANNLPYVATLAASQTGSTLIIPIDGLRVGDTITGFKVIAQIESAGGTVTLDGDLRAVTNVAAEPTDASIGTMTQVSVTADTASAQEKTGLTEVVTTGKSYYLKITGTTVASTDIILQHCEITTTASSTPEVVAEVVDIHIARAAGKVVSLEAAITGAIADDASRTVTVDLHRSTAEGAFATILSSTITFNSTSVLRRIVAGALTNNPQVLVDGDILRLIITVAGTTGNQAKGLAVCVRLKEGK